jgi:flagellar assembly protein FliH
MSESTVLSAERATTLQVWNAPAIESTRGSISRRLRRNGDLESEELAAYDQAREQARAEGMALARAELDTRIAKLDAQARLFEAALTAIARPLALMDNQMREQLTQLAIAIARQLLRRELKADPTQVIAIVRETVALLPAAARDVRVQLHPEDAALLRERLAAPQAESAWTILEDPVMSRGGCRVTAEAAQIDARIETRLAAVLSTLLGEERAAERIETTPGDAT